MKNPFYAILAFVSLTIAGFVYALDHIQSNDSLVGAALGVVGALLGAAVGGGFSGWYSYQAGIQVAKENYEMLDKQQKNISRAQLFNQIEFSAIKIHKWYDTAKVEGGNNKFFSYGQLVYDQEWHKHLAVLNDDISIDHQDSIILWFNALNDLSLMRNGYLIKGGDVVQFLDENRELKENVLNTLKYLRDLKY
jgi:xanthosine utilization system XapX-like protein